MLKSALRGSSGYWACYRFRKQKTHDKELLGKLPGSKPVAVLLQAPYTRSALSPRLFPFHRTAPRGLLLTHRDPISSSFVSVSRHFHFSLNIFLYLIPEVDCPRDRSTQKMHCIEPLYCSCPIYVVLVSAGVIPQKAQAVTVKSVALIHKRPISSLCKPRILLN